MKYNVHLFSLFLLFSPLLSPSLSLSLSLPPPLPRGLVNVFLSRWQIARECFEEASQLDPSNLAIQSNITVCTFYQGKLKEVCPSTASDCRASRGYIDQG